MEAAPALKDRARTWRRVGIALMFVGGIGLLLSPWLAYLIAEAPWRVHASYRAAANLGSDLNAALRPWFDERGIAWQPIPLSATRWLLSLAPVAAMALLTALFLYVNWTLRTP